MSETAAVTVGSTRLVALVGDLTKQDVDAIVNAANVNLAHGGGVAGAIARAGGATIQRESDEWTAQHGPLQRGQAAVTSGGDLPARHVVHTAGPVYESGSPDNEPHLRDAVRGALEAAREAGDRTVAFPAISAGIYGYPPDEATAVLVDEVAGFVRRQGEVFDEVRFVGLDQKTADQFAAGLRALEDA